MENAMGCFSCFKPSKESKETWKCWKGKSSKDDETMRKRKRKGFCGLCGKRSLKDGESPRKQGSTCCFFCKRSSKDEKTSKNLTKTNKPFTNLIKKKEGLRKGGKKDSPEEPLKRKGEGCMSCLLCCKPKKDKEESEGGKKKTTSCYCFSRTKSSSEDPSKRKGEGCMSCFHGGCCFSRTKSSSEDPSKRKGEGCMSCFHGCCCFSRTKSSSEDPSKRKGEGCMSCFHGCKPKKDKKEGLKGGKEKATTCCCLPHTKRSSKELTKRKASTCCCLPHTKRSSEESTKRKREGCMSCYWCFKSSKKDKEEELKRDNDKSSSRACVKPSESQSYFSCFRPSSTKAKGCFSCFKSSKKKESRKCAGKGTTTKPSDGKVCKSKCTKNASCSYGCTCCSSSANKKVKKPIKKKVWLSWRKKGKKKMHHIASLVKIMSSTSDGSKHRTAAEEILRIGNGNIAARVFTYCELVTATQNFAYECLLGEGGFGKVYKGHLKDSNRDIAVKKLDKKGYQGNREFVMEVLMLSLLSHPNLINLIGYCADGDERILVYDYMQFGSLQDHLIGLRPDSKPLDWNTRMKIAAGVAKGLEHLHDTANPPVIYRDLKPSNILLDDDFNPRLADFGLAKLGPVGAKNHVSTRVMGTFGYCAPEYALTGRLTKMSDIYSFGVVLLELISGRKAVDRTRPRKEQILVEWAAPLFKDKRNFIKMADPLLKGNFPVKALYQAVAISSMCLQEEDNNRPLIKDVVCALQFLARPGGDSPSSSEHENSVIENKIPPEPQLHQSPTEKSTSDSSEEEPLHSSENDWQSCSASRGDIEELKGRG